MSYDLLTDRDIAALITRTRQALRYTPPDAPAAQLLDERLAGLEREQADRDSARTAAENFG